MSYPAKVFGVGLSRTGTTSMCHAMTTLGYRAIHNPRDVVEIAAWCDFANDITVAWQFQLLDKLFPGSKFIYTTRDIESWLMSCQIHFNSEERADRLATGYATEDTAINAAYLQAELAIYGRQDFNADVWEAAYLRHDSIVRNYFAGRPNDLLILDVSAGQSSETWQTLLDFLELDEVPFPKLNASL